MQATKTQSRCKCGRPKGKYANLCTRCDRERREAYLKEARAVVATGRCPDCGSPLRRNLALKGWWQCSQYGADGFRADSTKPACNFQTMTD